MRKLLPILLVVIIWAAWSIPTQGSLEATPAIDETCSKTCSISKGAVVLRLTLPVGGLAKVTLKRSLVGLKVKADVAKTVADTAAKEFGGDWTGSKLVKMRVNSLVHRTITIMMIVQAADLSCGPTS